MKNTGVLALLLSLAFGARAGAERMVIRTAGNQLPVARAVEDLADSLRRVYPDCEIALNINPRPGDVIIRAGSMEDLSGRPDVPALEVADRAGAFHVLYSAEGGAPVLWIAGKDPEGVCNGVYALLEQMGCGFYLSFNTGSASRAGGVDFSGLDLSDAPLVSGRVMFNWHNFLTSCSVWDEADWQHWIRQSARMRYNSIMVHAYGNNPMTEFSFEGRVKPVGWLSSTDRGRDWAVEHVQDVRRLVGGELFEERVFGAECADVPDEQRVPAVKKMMRRVFDYAANDYGMDVVFAYDMDTHPANPQPLVLKLPESARVLEKRTGKWAPRPDAPEGKAYYRSLVGTLMGDLPQITDFVVWSRHEVELPWAFTLAPDDMPAEWRAELQSLETAHPDIPLHLTRKAVHMAQVARTVREVMDELGRPEVRVSFGTWLSPELLTAMDALCPEVIGFHLLDHVGWVSSNPDFQRTMKRIGQHRYLNLIEWAQNDNVGVAGRPAAPPPEFGTSLTERCGASAFGVIHWNWRPLDLYFRNLQRAVWQRTKDEPLAGTIRRMAEELGGERAGAVDLFLSRWMTEVDPFGCESAAQFDLAKVWGDNERVIQKSLEREQLLDTVDLAGLQPAQQEQLRFFKGHEKWLRQMFLDNRKSYSFDPDRIRSMDPRRAVRLFADAVKNGGADPGEKGLLVNLNLKWLTYRIAQLQELGEEPFRVNFQPTHHDPLAQNYSRHTFTFDERQRPWAGRGLQETGYPVQSVEGWQEQAGLPLLAGSWIEAPDEIHVKINGLHGQASVPVSRGVLTLFFPAVAERVSMTVSAGDAPPYSVTLEPGGAGTHAVMDEVDVPGGVLELVVSNPGGTVFLGAVEYRVTACFAPGGSDGLVLEAERAVQMNDAVLRRLYSGFSGTGFADMGGAGSWIEWVVPEAVPDGASVLECRYALVAGSRPLAVTLNGVAAGTAEIPATGAWDQWAASQIALPSVLSAGDRIRLTAGDAGGPNVDALVLRAADAGPIHQAETPSAASGCVPSAVYPGFGGTGFIDMGGAGTWIEWQAVPGDGRTGTIRFRYAADRLRPCELLVNGQSAGTVNFTATGDWKTWREKEFPVTLKEGMNRIRLVSGAYGGPNLDWISVDTP